MLCGSSRPSSRSTRSKVTRFSLGETWATKVATTTGPFVIGDVLVFYEDVWRGPPDDEPRSSVSALRVSDGQLVWTVRLADNTITTSVTGDTHRISVVNSGPVYLPAPSTPGPIAASASERVDIDTASGAVLSRGPVDASSSPGNIHTGIDPTLHPLETPVGIILDASDGDYEGCRPD
jgi:hypothetical protein